QSREAASEGPPTDRSVDVRVAAQVLEDLQAALLVDHQVDTVAAVAPLQAPLRLDEILVVALPVAPAAALAHLAQVLLPVLAEALQQLVLQRHEALAAARVALPARAADPLAVDPLCLVP